MRVRYTDWARLVGCHAVAALVGHGYQVRSVGLRRPAARAPPGRQYMTTRLLSYGSLRAPSAERFIRHIAHECKEAVAPCLFSPISVSAAEKYAKDNITTWVR